MQLSCRPAPMRSCARSCPQKSAVSCSYRPAIRGASVRLEATAQSVIWQAWADLTTGGSPPKPPTQDKALGGAGQPEDPSATEGLWNQLLRWVKSMDGNSLALIAAWLTVLAWYKGVATTADVDKSVKDSEKRVEKSVKDSEEHTKERVQGVQKSVDNLRSEMKTVVTWPSLLSYVAILAVGIAGGVFVTLKLKK